MLSLSTMSKDQERNSFKMYVEWKSDVKLNDEVVIGSERAESDPRLGWSSCHHFFLVLLIYVMRPPPSLHNDKRHWPNASVSGFGTPVRISAGSQRGCRHTAPAR